MKKTAARKAKTVRSKAMVVPAEGAFDEIVALIRAARQQAARAVNTELIELYWRIGDYLHRKIESDGWAKGTVVQLAAYIAQREPGLRGFSPQNLWRMRQFFVIYRDFPKLSPLLRELPWSSHLHILSRSKRPEEREFYLRLATQNRWPVREVARQLDGALFERAVLSPPKLSTVLRELHPAAASHFKDAYLLEFLALPSEHSEADLHHSLLRHPYLAKGSEMYGAVVRDLFEALRKEVLALDPCVSEEFTKYYVAYKAETNFVDVVAQAKRLRLSLNMAFPEINDPKGLCRDTTNIGRWGNGDVEVGLKSLDELPYVMGLVRQSYERQMGDGGQA
jgi:predicted transport protein/predicted nuclease of restriction endonuclease-like (RecB) superfamily